MLQDNHNNNNSHKTITTINCTSTGGPKTHGGGQSAELQAHWEPRSCIPGEKGKPNSPGGTLKTGGETMRQR